MGRRAAVLGQWHFFAATWPRLEQFVDLRGRCRENSSPWRLAGWPVAVVFVVDIVWADHTRTGATTDAGEPQPHLKVSWLASRTDRQEPQDSAALLLCLICGFSRGGRADEHPSSNVS